MIQIIRPKPSEYDGDTRSNDEINIGDTKTKETDSFDRTVAITRYGMRLLGFWPQDTQLLCHLQCGTILAVTAFVFFPAIMQMCIMIYNVTDWNAVMHQSIDVILSILILSKFIFMKVMAKNFRFVLQVMTTDWADYRYLTKRSQRIMVYYARKGKGFSTLSTAFMALAGTAISVKFVEQTVKLRRNNYQSIFTSQTHLLSMNDTLGYILTPIMNMWRSDDLWNVTTRTLPTQGFYPFRYKESPVYEILYVVQSLVTFFSATALSSVDCFLYIIVFHVCGQFDILAVNLKRYDGTIRHHYAKDIGDARNCACLSCIVKRHVHILSFASIIEKSFRNFLLLQLLGFWFKLVFQGRELVLVMDIYWLFFFKHSVRHNNINGIVTCVLYMLTIMYNIFIHCYISECIIDRSENIGRIAHNLEWERFPRDSNLPIIVARTRIPCKLTAGMFFTLSFPCYTTILMTTVSYISVLAAFIK